MALSGDTAMKTTIQQLMHDVVDRWPCSAEITESGFNLWSVSYKGRSASLSFVNSGGGGRWGLLSLTRADVGLLGDLSVKSYKAPSPNEATVIICRWLYQGFKT